MRKLILPAFVVAMLFLASSYAIRIHAQSPIALPSSIILTPTPTIVKSDFAIDLEEGEKDIANDQEAKQNQKDQKDNENIDVNEQGEVENEQEEIKQKDMEQSNNDLNDDIDKEKSTNSATDEADKQESNE